MNRTAPNTTRIEAKRRRQVRFVALAVAVTAAVALAPLPALAACNTAGCWAETVEMIRVDEDGRIWFVTQVSDNLGALAPSDCTMRQIWTGIAEYALYIPPADPARSEKYALLLNAQLTGQKVGFSPTLDPVTGWCSLRGIDVTIDAP